MIKLKLTARTLPDSKQLKTLRIVQRPNGIMVDLGYEVEKEPLPANEQAIGIDLGVINRLALSDGTLVESRRIDRRREKRLQRAVSRSHKGSNHRRKRVKMLARERHRNVTGTPCGTATPFTNDYPTAKRLWLSGNGKACNPQHDPFSERDGGKPRCQRSGQAGIE